MHNRVTTIKNNLYIPNYHLLIIKIQKTKLFTSKVTCHVIILKSHYQPKPIISSNVFLVRWKYVCCGRRKMHEPVYFKHAAGLMYSRMQPSPGLEFGVEQLNCVTSIFALVPIPSPTARRRPLAGRHGRCAVT